MAGNFWFFPTQKTERFPTNTLILWAADNSRQQEIFAIYSGGLKRER